MITLTPFQLGDVPLLMALDRDPECARWFDFPPITMDEPAHRAHAAGVLARWQTEAAEGTAYHLAVRVDDVAIGMVAVRRIGEATAGMSYAIVLAHRGQGYATRAAQLLIKHAFDDLGFTRIELRTDLDNIASQRVAERAGFTFVRVDKHAHTFKQYEPFKGEARDERVYELRFG